MPDLPGPCPGSATGIECSDLPVQNFSFEFTFRLSKVGRRNFIDLIIHEASVKQFLIAKKIKRLDRAVRLIFP